MVTRFEAERVRSNVRQATTEDLLDRATVYRTAMESEALGIIEDELRSRGVKAAEIEAHTMRRNREVIRLPDGTAARCSFCDRPAVAQGWGWHQLWSVVPLFRRWYYYCLEHQPQAKRERGV
jgi:hypothetical protein